MAKFIKNNRERISEGFTAVALNTYLHDILSRLKHTSYNKKKKALLRGVKHYLHSMQLCEQKFNKREKNVSFIYVIKNRAYQGYVKIGRTSSMEDRLTQYKVYTPKPDDLEVFYIPTLQDSRYLERCILSRYKESNISGEWLEKDFESLVKELKEIFLKEFMPLVDRIINAPIN